MTNTDNRTQYLDKKNGCARQGDVLIWPLPEGYTVSRADKIKEKGGRIILLEGEATGHHHSIGFKLPTPALFRDDAIAASVETSCSAALYADETLTKALTEAGYLTTDRLCIGYLVVENASAIVEHQEHAPISVPPGAYYIGRQREFTAGEFRNVQD